MRANGTWQFRNEFGQMAFPPRIECCGRRFSLAGWEEAKPGVVAQYREAVAENSHHLYVLANGRWLIAHVDQVNPDLGDVTAPVRHFAVDHPVGRAAVGVGLTVGLVALIGALLE